MNIEPIKLTAEQENLRGVAKSSLYVQCYKQVVNQMRDKGIKFPRDKRGTNELGINVTKLATWCAFKDRATLYNNSTIRKALPGDIRDIGIEDQEPKSIIENKHEKLVADQARDIDEQGALILTLNARIQMLEQQLKEKDSIISTLEVSLAGSEQTVKNHMDCHAEQIANSILSGGRTFERA
ncbi:hypothetical protein NMT39_002285 [Vibrio cholerae]|nr:hypothetical protein [Vibrio cholerae]